MILSSATAFLYPLSKSSQARVLEGIGAGFSAGTSEREMTGFGSAADAASVVLTVAGMAGFGALQDKSVNAAIR
jgi:hypothetical protein